MATRTMPAVSNGTYPSQHLYNDVQGVWWLDRVEHAIWAFTQWAMLLLALRGTVAIMSAAAENRLGNVLNFITDPLLVPINHFMQSQSDVFEVNVAVAIAVYGVAGWLIAGMVHIWKQINVRLLNGETYKG